MGENTENPNRIAAGQGKSCTCTCNVHTKGNVSSDSMQELADIALASLKPALRSFLGSPTYRVKPVGEFIIAWSEAVFAELEKRERRA